MDRLTDKKSRNPICAAQGGICVSAEFVARLAAYEDAMPIERAQELAKAEKDGRLVILPPNDPLTLSELREMGGYPVWVVPVDGKYCPKWMIADTDAEVCRNPDRSQAMFETLGRKWNAFRRKPEVRNAET